MIRSSESLVQPPKIPTTIPSLNGIRAISIGAVVFGHLVGTQGFPINAGALSHVGNLGVRCFFIISGFLITTLLLREWHATGRISLSRFYVRRSLRIFPAFYFFIFVMFWAWHLGWIELKSGDLFHALTFTMNYHHELAWSLNHLWSLSAEEQFYLLWPGILAMAGLRRGMLLAIIVVLIAPLIRWWMWSHGVVPSAFTREFQAMADSLAVGCLLAANFNALSANPTYSKLLSSPAFLIIPSVALLLSVVFGVDAYYIWGQSVANLGMAIAIHWAIRYPTTFLGEILNSAPFVWLGTISYSLYLWQEPFLNPTSRAWFTAFPVNIIFTLAAALFSYWIIEQQFLRLKPK